MDKKKRGVNTCSRCEQPVYFAERKTSLGKDWHPNCLRCEQCSKILTPGQHAERKGVPYCHKPCYGALFGPQIFGYGSNISSPANVKKSADIINASNDGTPEGMKCVFKTTHTSPGPLKLNKLDGDDTSPRLVQKRHSSGSVETGSIGNHSNSGSSGYHSNSGSSSLSGSSSALNTISENNSSGLKCVYRSSEDVKPNPSNSDVKPKDGGKFPPPKAKPSQARGAELFKRVQSYNEYHQNKRGQALTIGEDEESGNVRVQGPLRIYWGLKKPIMLKQYDEVPTAPNTNFKKRFSVITDQKDLKPLPEIRTESASPPASPRKTHNGGGGFDDSVLSSPLSDVVMRRTNIKKSNTVAYRGDSSKLNRWKRASINGHIYNYDTSVFTPVLGSCTSVTVDNKMTVEQVVKTLLDKFKVENEPTDFNLSIITEQESQRQLRASDIPLLERLALGPSDSIKIFIQDRPDKPAILPTFIPNDSSPSADTPVQETPLPEEVEQLLDLPEPVLRGILLKFKGDEEQEVRRLRAKYERIRRRVQQIIDDKKANQTRC